ncbi:MAG: methylmalonyl-CoA mutase family protein [Cohaesibacteraceae bacterium]
MNAAGFEDGGFARWQALVDKALKGASADSLVHQTDDGITLQPLYPTASAPAIAMRGGDVPWTIAQRVDHPDPAKAHAQAMADLEGGATGLMLACQGSPGAYGYGVLTDDLPVVLDGVLTDAIRLTLDPSPARARDARALAAVLDASAPANTSIHVDFGLDPASILAGTGGLRGDEQTALEAQGRHFHQLLAFGFGGTIFRADGRLVHNAGGTDAEELGFILAGLALAMRSIDDPALAAERTLLMVSVDADQFAGIAKLRALRLLHAKLMEACDINAFAPRLHSETSLRMLTKRDPHVNMLRTTTAVFAAAVGGSDTVTTLPFTQALGFPDGFARRTARNTQLVLLEESSLDQGKDPAAGSGLYEHYTETLCEKAWSAFQTIEAEGGVLRSLASGAIQARVKTSQEARATEIAAGDRKLTGATVFQLETEYPVEVEDVAPVSYRLKEGLKLYADRLELAPLEPSNTGEPA